MMSDKRATYSDHIWLSAVKAAILIDRKRLCVRVTKEIINNN